MRLFGAGVNDSPLVPIVECSLGDPADRLTASCIYPRFSKARPGTLGPFGLTIKVGP
jgi:hypothetical protein